MRIMVLNKGRTISLKQDEGHFSHQWKNEKDGGGKPFILKAEDMKLREFPLDGFTSCIKVPLSAKNERKGIQGEG